MIMEEEQPLTRVEYDALPLGEDRWSFLAFGNVSLETLRAHCKHALGLTDLQIGQVEDAWARHPKRFNRSSQQPGE